MRYANSEPRASIAWLQWCTGRQAAGATRLKGLPEQPPRRDIARSHRAQQAALGPPNQTSNARTLCRKARFASVASGGVTRVDQCCASQVAMLLASLFERATKIPMCPPDTGSSL